MIQEVRTFNSYHKLLIIDAREYFFELCYRILLHRFVHLLEILSHHPEEEVVSVIFTLAMLVRPLLFQ